MPKKSKQVRYPWDRWLSKRRTTLRRGRDFQCQLHSMGVQMRNAALLRGIPVSVHLKDDVLVVEVKGRR